MSSKERPELFANTPMHGPFPSPYSPDAIRCDHMENRPANGTAATVSELMSGSYAEAPVFLAPKRRSRNACFLQCSGVFLLSGRRRS